MLSLLKRMDSHFTDLLTLLNNCKCTIRWIILNFKIANLISFCIIWQSILLRYLLYIDFYYNFAQHPRSHPVAGGITVALRFKFQKISKIIYHTFHYIVLT